MKPGSPNKGILNNIEALKRAGITCTWDEFKQKEYWSGHDDNVFDSEVSDAAVAIARRNLAAAFRLAPGPEEMRHAITCACHDNRSNPVLEYFARLKWDGKPRLGTMLHVYLGADDTPLNAAYGTKFMCAIIRRTKQPGCKSDGRLDLQGAQDIGKSMFCADLAVFRDLFTDAGDLSMSIKEQMEIGEGMQIIEFAENVGHSRARRNENKRAITRQTERARKAYAHYATDSPRTWVGIATLNPGGYLNDPTGERRYWNVLVRLYNREAFLADKDQLYAEAVAREPTEKLWLDTPELKAAHDAVTAAAKEPDELVDILTDLKGEIWHVDGAYEERVSTATIRSVLGLLNSDTCRVQNIGRRINEAMMHLGWTKAPNTICCYKQGEKGHPTSGYSRPAQKPDP
jgi:predicted P-loop ATPase